MSQPSPAAAGQRMRALGLRPNRRLSQSFLRSPQIAQAMAHAAKIEPDDLVLEIGPGLGILTRELVRTAREVVAIELDSGLAAALGSSIGNPPNLRVVHADALKADLAELVAPPFKVVASLPYHVATPILFRLAFEAPTPDRIVVMLQEEVARRIVGAPGGRTFLNVALSVAMAPRLVRLVPAGAFHPVPKVRSAIVRLDRLAEAALPPDAISGFIDFLHAGFTQPRRQLHNSLAQGLQVAGAASRSILEEAAVDPSRRPADLTLDEWLRVFSVARRPAA
jgi:16S rRNA (adenine1518-N6/adenine1519-N6)-dimethyltransferase